VLLRVLVRLGHHQHDPAVARRHLRPLDVDRREEVEVEAVLVRLGVRALALAPEDQVAVLAVGVVGELDVGGLAVLFCVFGVVEGGERERERENSCESECPSSFLPFLLLLASARRRLLLLPIKLSTLFASFFVNLEALVLPPFRGSERD